MRIIEKELPITHTLPKAYLSYLPEMRKAVFDIETTGFSPFSHQVILIGILFIYEDRLLVRQYFADNIMEEDQILLEFAKAALDVDVFFNYNGDRFDIPFLNKRCQKHGIDFCLPTHSSIDIYKIIRNSYFKELVPDLKQKTVEKLFSGDRIDDISGEMSVSLYKEYCDSGEYALARKILLHNFDDVRILYEILQVFSKVDIHKAAAENGFFVRFGAQKSSVALVRDVKLGRGGISAHVFSASFNSYIDEYLSDCHLVIMPETQKMSLQIPVFSEPDFSYVDISSYGLLDELSSLPGCHSGYLILSREDAPEYLAINRFLQELLCKILIFYDIL